MSGTGDEESWPSGRAGSGARGWGQLLVATEHLLCSGGVCGGWMHHPGVHHPRIHRARGGLRMRNSQREGRQGGTDGGLGASGFPSARAWVRPASADPQLPSGGPGGQTEDREDSQGTGRMDGAGRDRQGARGTDRGPGGWTGRGWEDGRGARGTDRGPGGMDGWGLGGWTEDREGQTGNRKMDGAGAGGTDRGPGGMD